VSDRLKAARRATERLRNAPVAMALPAKADGTCCNTPSGKELFSQDSSKYPGHIIMHHPHPAGRLLSTLQQKRQMRNPAGWRDSRIRSEFLKPLLIHLKAFLDN
jgi:hypothetical protein